MTKFPKILLTILASIVVYLLTAIPRDGYFSILGISGFPLSILIGVIVYYSVMALLLRKPMGTKYMLALLTETRIRR